MRNLKKILALVLALVMSFSLMATANAFKDSEKITGTYEEAVEVLNALKVFQGYDDGSFQPQGSITRAEVATIIYRIVTGDVEDKQVGIYADYNKFNDVKSTSWYAGYVNFCANAEYIKGYDAKTFGPNDPVTGYQALAMILRAVGYDKNGEFTGSDWQVQTAAVGKKLGVTNNVSEGTLGTAASREVVAEILFRAIQVPQVTYTLAFGYNDSTLGVKNDSIGYETFKLIGAVDANDNWGRPSKEWKLDKAPYNKVLETSDTKLVSIAIDPIVSYTTPVTQCQVAQDAGFTGVKSYVTYTNGLINKGTVSLVASNTVSTIGAQGRQTLVYSDRIVYIDTLLAQVTAVTPVRYDAAQHIITQAALTMNVYDNDASVTVFVQNSSTDFTYAVGDMLLVNAVQTQANNKVINVGEYKYMEIIGVAQSMVGAQSTIWNNTAKHVINGTTYDDNNRFHFDQAGTETINHTWFMDQYGNLIGAANITSTNYAVLKSIRWVVGNPGYAEAVLVDMTGAESTVTVATMDGDTNPAQGSTFDGWDTDNAVLTYASSNVNGGRIQTTPNRALVSDEALLNTNFNGYALYRVDTRMDGSVDLTGCVTTTSGIASVVNYVAGANFSANASAILNQNNVVTYVSSNTQYLVRGANNTYTAITGTQAMATYATANLFYVDVNGDSIADYVYIKNGVEASAAANLIYVTTAAYTGPLTNNGVTFWTMEVLVNGQPQTVVDVSRNGDLVRELSNNVNKLFYATYNVAPQFYYLTSFGTLATLTKVDANEIQIGTSNTFARYLPLTRILNGDTLVCTNAAVNSSYRVDAAAIYGTATALDANVLAYDGIWVVYTKGVVNTASAVYVGALLDTSTALNVAAANGTVTNDGNNTFTATMDKDVASTTMTYTANRFATITAPGNNVGEGIVTEMVNNQNPSRAVSVANEEGTATVNYTVKLVWVTSSNDASLKSVKVDGTDVTIPAGRTDPKADSAVYLGSVAKFTLSAEANSAAAKVEIGSGDTLDNAVKNLAVRNSVEVTETTALNGGYIVIRVTAENGTVLNYVYNTAAAPQP